MFLGDKSDSNKILTTLPFQFPVFYAKNWKDINFLFFGKYVTALVQKLKKKFK